MAEKKFEGDILGAANHSITEGLKGKRGNSYRAKIKHKGHEFWLHPVKVKNFGNTNTYDKFEVQISHILKGFDNQCYVTLLFKNGYCISEDTKINKSKNMSIVSKVLQGAGIVVGTIVGAGAGGSVGYVGGKTAAEMTNIIAKKVIGNWEDVLGIITYSIMNHLSYFTDRSVFDPVYYLGLYQDIRHECGATNYKKAMEHWMTCGINEGRKSSADFDIAYYLNSHPDLINAFGSGNYSSAFTHWLNHGKKEGRRTIG